MRKKVTIDTIAKIAGVSKMTVSRVLNHPELVSKRTLIKVRKIIEELGYHPRADARTLAGGRVKTLGFLIKSSSEFALPPFYNECVLGAFKIAKEKGYRFIMYDLIDETSISLLTDHIHSHFVEGLIIFEGVYEETLIKRILDSGITVVFVGEKIRDDFITISSDNKNGAREAVEYLILKRGCKRLIHIAGTDDKPSCLEREMAYLEVVKNYGVENLGIVRTSSTLEGGVKAAREIIKNGIIPDGIFCFSDIIAIGAMHELVNHGFSIPKDIKIVGFDDIILSRYTTPPLTTVHQDIAKMGELAVLTLIQILDNKNEPRQKHIVFPTHLVIRKSA